MKIGENIKKFRNKKGWTQKELATELKVTPVTIQNYENNRRKPDFVVLNELADILDCKLFDLLGIESPEKTVGNPESYFLEQYINTLGYELIFDEDNFYLILKSSEGEFEITENDIEELKSNSKSFIEYKLHEIMKKSRKIGK